MLGKGGDGISKASVRATERLGGNVDGTCLAAGMVAGEGSTCGSGRTRAEDLGRKLGVLQKLTIGGVLRKL